jgi:hypothetical protein
MSSIWEHLPLPTIATPLLREPVEVAPTPMESDLQLIKQALSTLSASSQHEAAFHPLVVTPQLVINPTPILVSPACYEVSVRPNADLITIGSSSASTALAQRSWATIRHRTKNASPSLSHVTFHNRTKHDNVEPCSCTLPQHVHNQLLTKALDILGPARQYALSATRYLDFVLTPTYIEMRKEMGELVALANTMVETSSTLTQFVIHRAARGLSISRHALNRMTARMKLHIPMPVLGNSTGEHSLRQDLARARASIDTLQEHVDVYTSAITGYVEEQAQQVRERGMKNLKQARRGLDRVFAEVRRAVDGSSDGLEGEDIEREQLLSLLASEGRSKSHRERSVSSRRNAVRKHPEAEKSSRGKKMWDALHHVSMISVYNV